MNIPKMTDEQALALLLQSDLWDMHKHVGWYSAPERNFKEKGVALIQSILAARDAQVQAALAEQEPVAWIPISSAPKDGTHILAHLPDRDTCYVVCWADITRDIRANLGDRVGWHMAYDGDFLEPHDEPTHWVPLPAAPGAAQPEPSTPAAQERWAQCPETDTPCRTCPTLRIPCEAAQERAEPVAPAVWDTELLCDALHSYAQGMPNTEYHRAIATKAMALWSELRSATPPAPAQPADPMDWPLPCDVTVGGITMCKGVRLHTLVSRMKKLHEAEFGPPPSPEEMADRRARFLSAAQPSPEPSKPEQAEAPSAVLAYLDGLKDDAAAHIYPSDLAKCNTSECAVEVFSVRVGNGEERSVPLFSREQVAEALNATLPPAIAAGDSGAGEREADLEWLLEQATAHWSTYKGDVVISSGYSIWIDAPHFYGKRGDIIPPDNSRLRDAIRAARTRGDEVGK